MRTNTSNICIRPPPVDIWRCFGLIRSLYLRQTVERLRIFQLQASGEATRSSGTTGWNTVRGVCFRSWIVPNIGRGTHKHALENKPLVDCLLQHVPTLKENLSCFVGGHKKVEMKSPYPIFLKTDAWHPNFCPRCLHGFRSKYLGNFTHGSIV